MVMYLFVNVVEKEIYYNGNYSSFCVFAESELNELFSRKAVITSRNSQDCTLPQQAPVSLLSRLVQQYPDGLNNPFLEYAKFDGTVSLDLVLSIHNLKYYIISMLISKLENTYIAYLSSRDLGGTEANQRGDTQQL